MNKTKLTLHLEINRNRSTTRGIESNCQVVFVSTSYFVVIGFDSPLSPKDYQSYRNSNDNINNICTSIIGQHMYEIPNEFLNAMCCLLIYMYTK